jgi:hypothetical protein
MVKNRVGVEKVTVMTQAERGRSVAKRNRLLGLEIGD